MRRLDKVHIFVYLVQMFLFLLAAWLIRPSSPWFAAFSIYWPWAEFALEIVMLIFVWMALKALIHVIVFCLQQRFR